MLMRFLVPLILAFGVLAATAARAEDSYRLGPGDRLRIEVFEQPSLSREALIQADGSVHLPRIGTVALGGHTLEEAREVLGERLITDLGLTKPDVTVEVAVYRPIYLIGDVQAPGAYAYAPGMTVLHAITLAGGYRRPELGDATARLEVGRLLERLEQLRDQLAISHARLARYLAERDGGEPAEVPELARLVTPERAAELRKQEAAQMKERSASLEGASRIFEQRRSQLREEVTALQAQRDAKIRQHESLENELAAIKDLKEQGLVLAQRLFDLDRALIATEADRREVEAFIARAKGEIASVDQNELNRRSDLRLDIINGIKDVSDEISQQRAAIAAVDLQVEVARGLSLGLDVISDGGGLGFDKPMVKRRGAVDFVPIGLTDLLQADDLVAIPQRTLHARD
jgi:polysaccharide biosynthesis/export protein ExoF